MTGSGTGPLWQLIEFFAHIAGGIALATVAIWLAGRRDRLGQAGTAIVVALTLTAVWALVVAASQSLLLGAITETARNLGWLAVLYRFFASDGRHTSLAPIRPVVFALAFVELLNLAISVVMTRAPLEPHMVDIAFSFHAMFRLLVTVGALMLVHNLYAGASEQARTALRWPASGLAILWITDLNLYTVAYLGSGWPVEIAAVRGLAAVALALLVAMAASKGRDDLRLRPSRAVTFQTFSLLIIGVYLVGMVAIAQWLSYAGGNFARLMELGFLTIASAAALLLLPSKRMRGWLKVTLTKHFFQHRYDYREEWLRFTRTIGNSGGQALPLGERAVQAVADIAECPAGLLLAPGEDGDLALAARWNWPEIEVPGTALSAASVPFFERESFIADLDEMREGRSGKADKSLFPEWLLDHPRAWALVPLIHYERLVGMIVLARPSFSRKFDWEDFDLLRVVGQQLASYLAENSSQIALVEASRFDDFHRRIAFVMHDIKNLASQLSLLARNAELHADKKEFRDDMLVTLRNSADKLNALIARLSRYGNGAVESLEEISAATVTQSVLRRFAGNPQVMLAGCDDTLITANSESLEQVLVHLIQNGIDASKDESPVFLSLTGDGLHARFDVVDSGCGMSPEFTRSKLFKPFVSTKSGGFGIGAFEARELVRAMRGRLEVESREGLGSRFTVRIPAAGVAKIYENVASNERKLAS
ncbi:MAG: PEP-CTERM system histidine kinase PrsK [Sphingomonadaceae bacterium]|nr:PEP-CTERM system histidine kinase PrsK [Sphingomonadaceae bacterium]